MGRIGMMFQEARTEQGFTLGEVAEALNIDVRYIFDLEDEDYDDMPGKTFVIGYAKSYAKFLGLNSKRITEAIAKEIGYDVTASRGDGMEQELFGENEMLVNRRREIENFKKRSQKNRQYMLGIIVVLLVLCLLSFLGTRTWI